MRPFAGGPHCHVERVHLAEDFQSGGHDLVILGRPVGGGGRCYLNGQGEWTQLPENAHPGRVGIALPEGVLDEIVRQHVNVQPRSTAADDALDDARHVRDRLLTLVERTVEANTAPPGAVYINEARKP